MLRCVHTQHAIYCVEEDQLKFFKNALEKTLEKKEKTSKSKESKTSQRINKLYRRLLKPSTSKLFS